ncbi:hypothetical protein [Bradyrhizobium sp. JR4.1]|uniref:hypothetical protein n=1 Tax=Bradyrhizobium sp. JR4.1 TaxID=3156372 RepID=UPI003392D5B2
MIAFRDLEPLAGKEMLAFTYGHRGVTTMAVKQAVHLVARRNAFEDFADAGGGVHRRLLFSLTGLKRERSA